MAKKNAETRVPISALREFAKAQGLDTVVLLGWCQSVSRDHVVTWGRTGDMCDAAAMMGARVKKLAGWPESTWSTEPSRVKKLKKELRDIEDDLHTALGLTGVADLNIAELLGRVNEKLESVDKLEAEITELKEEVESAQGEVDDLQQELDAKE